MPDLQTGRVWRGRDSRGRLSKVPEIQVPKMPIYNGRQNRRFMMMAKTPRRCGRWFSHEGDSHHQLNGTNNSSFSRRILIISTSEVFESVVQIYRTFSIVYRSNPVFVRLVPNTA
jgi:hypothetical protein